MFEDYSDGISFLVTFLSLHYLLGFGVWFTPCGILCVRSHRTCPVEVFGACDRTCSFLGMIKSSSH